MPNTLPQPNAASGNYPPANAAGMTSMFNQGAFSLQLAVDYTLADAAVLYTVPTGIRLAVGRSFWEVTTAFTGGSSSAIGISSSNSGYNTKGDLLGGASGDVLAGLTTGFKGTIGAKSASQGVIVLIAADTIRFDRITSVFTAGVGIVHVPCWVLPTA